MPSQGRRRNNRRSSKVSRSTPTRRLSTFPTTTPDVKRQIVISGGFLNNLASNDDPKAFVYAFDGGAFPNVPLIQPRLNSVEEWKFINNNNDEHPIHVHVNDFQVIDYFDPDDRSANRPRQVGRSTMPTCRRRPWMPTKA